MGVSVGITKIRKTLIAYDDGNVWVPTPEGCLLVWGNEEWNWSQKVFKKNVRRVYNGIEGIG